MQTLHACKHKGYCKTGRTIRAGIELSSDINKDVAPHDAPSKLWEGLKEEVTDRLLRFNLLQSQSH
jgi:hypothetical protein